MPDASGVQQVGPSISSSRQMPTLREYPPPQSLTHRRAPQHRERARAHRPLVWCSAPMRQRIATGRVVPYCGGWDRADVQPVATPAFGRPVGDVGRGRRNRRVGVDPVASTRPSRSDASSPAKVMGVGGQGWMNQSAACSGGAHHRSPRRAPLARPSDGRPEVAVVSWCRCPRARSACWGEPPSGRGSGRAVGDAPAATVGPQIRPALALSWAKNCG